MGRCRGAAFFAAGRLAAALLAVFLDDFFAADFALRAITMLL
jgi:hypothetical protein